MNAPVDNITTYELSAWRDNNDTDASNWHAWTTYQAYVPTEQVQTLQNLVNDPSSALFKAQKIAVAGDLASYISPKFNILSNGGTQKSSQFNTVPGDDGHNGMVRNVIIGVCVAVGVVLLLLVGFLLWKRSQRSKRVAPSAGVTRAPTIRSFGLRETWAPNQHEQERVMNTGNLAEVWSHHDGEMSERVASASPPGVNPFADPAGSHAAASAIAGTAVGARAMSNRASRETERYHSGHDSLSSNTHSLTPSQRIQMQYEEQHGMAVSTGQSGGRVSMVPPVTSSRQSNYGTPAQHTSNHAYGPGEN